MESDFPQHEDEFIPGATRYENNVRNLNGWVAYLSGSLWGLLLELGWDITLIVLPVGIFFYVRSNYQLILQYPPALLGAVFVIVYAAGVIMGRGRDALRGD